MFGWGGGKGQEFVALMYLLGGLLMLSSRLITWHVPLAFLAGLAITAGGLHLLEPARHAGVLLHLFSGGAMLGAFFIATDPVTAASTPLGKLIYAGLAGFLTAIIRGFGGYPDGVAFAGADRQRLRALHRRLHPAPRVRPPQGGRSERPMAMTPACAKPCPPAWRCWCSPWSAPACSPAPTP
jgi:hypothetical protein